MSEKLVKEAVKKYLREIGAYYFMPVQMGYGATTLDFLVCYQGMFFGIETKREGVNSATLQQACVMRDIARSGGGVVLENDPAIPKVREMIR